VSGNWVTMWRYAFTPKIFGYIKVNIEFQIKYKDMGKILTSCLKTLVKNYGILKNLLQIYNITSRILMHNIINKNIITQVQKVTFHTPAIYQRYAA
jgi:hypothetical protein